MTGEERQRTVKALRVTADLIEMLPNGMVAEVYGPKPATTWGRRESAMLITLMSAGYLIGKLLERLVG